MYRFFLIFFSSALIAQVGAEPPPLPKEEFLEECGPTRSLSLFEAVEVTLREQADIEIAQLEVFKQRGKVQESKGPFDPLFTLRADLGCSDDVQCIGERSHCSGYRSCLKAEAIKEMRLGTKASLVVTGEGKKDPLKSKASACREYGKSGLSFRIDQPVLKGFRFGSAAVSELAAQRTLRAVCYESLHKIAGQILKTALAYWDVAASRRILEVRKEAEARFELLFKEISHWAELGKIKPEEANQPLAELAKSRIERALAEQELYSSIQALKASMGIVDPDWNGDLLFYAADAFPSPEADVAKLCEGQMNRLVEMALKNRLDIMASLQKEEAAKIQLLGSYNKRLPRCDLFAKVGLEDHASVSERGYSCCGPYAWRCPEKDWSVGLFFSKPLCNDSAKGAISQNRSALRQSILKTQDLKEEIITKVLDSWTKHLRAVSQLGNAKAAVDKFRALVKDNLGRMTEEGVLFELVNFQNSLTNSEVAYTKLLQTIAKNLALIRYQTGTLLSPETSLECVFVEDLATLPLF